MSDKDLISVEEFEKALAEVRAKSIEEGVRRGLAQAAAFVKESHVLNGRSEEVAKSLAEGQWWSRPREVKGDVEDMAKAVAANPHDNTARLVYADALEEAGKEHEATVHRVLAGQDVGRLTKRHLPALQKIALELSQHAQELTAAHGHEGYTQESLRSVRRARTGRRQAEGYKSGISDHWVAQITHEYMAGRHTQDHPDESFIDPTAEAAHRLAATAHGLADGLIKSRGRGRKSIPENPDHRTSDVLATHAAVESDPHDTLAHGVHADALDEAGAHQLATLHRVAANPHDKQLRDQYVATFEPKLKGPNRHRSPNRSEIPAVTQAANHATGETPSQMGTRRAGFSPGTDTGGHIRLAGYHSYEYDQTGDPLHLAAYAIHLEAAFHHNPHRAAVSAGSNALQATYAQYDAPELPEGVGELVGHRTGGDQDNPPSILRPEPRETRATFHSRVAGQMKELADTHEDRVVTGSHTQSMVTHARLAEEFHRRAAAHYTNHKGEEEDLAAAMEKYRQASARESRPRGDVKTRGPIHPDDAYGHMLEHGTGWVHPDGKVTPVPGVFRHTETLLDHPQFEHYRDQNHAVVRGKMFHEALRTGHVHVTTTGSGTMIATGTREALASNHRYLKEIAGRRDLEKDVYTPEDYDSEGILVRKGMDHACRVFKSEHDMIASYERGDHDPLDNTARLAYADALDEAGHAHEAAIHRFVADQGKESLEHLHRVGTFEKARAKGVTYTTGLRRAAHAVSKYAADHTDRTAEATTPGWTSHPDEMSRYSHEALGRETPLEPRNPGFPEEMAIWASERSHASIGGRPPVKDENEQKEYAADAANLHDDVVLGHLYSALRAKDATIRSLHLHGAVLHQAAATAHRLATPEAETLPGEGRDEAGRRTVGRQITRLWARVQRTRGAKAFEGPDTGDIEGTRRHMEANPGDHLARLVHADSLDDAGYSVEAAFHRYLGEPSAEHRRHLEAIGADDHNLHTLDQLALYHTNDLLSHTGKTGQRTLHANRAFRNAMDVTDVRRTPNYTDHEQQGMSHEMAEMEHRYQGEEHTQHAERQFGTERQRQHEALSDLHHRAGQLHGILAEIHYSRTNPPRETKSAHDMIASWGPHLYHDKNARLVYADALEETGDEAGAALHRAVADPSEENLRRLHEVHGTRKHKRIANKATVDALELGSGAIEASGEAGLTHSHDIAAWGARGETTRDNEVLVRGHNRLVEGRATAERHAALALSHDKVSGWHTERTQDSDESHLRASDAHTEAAELHRQAAAHHAALALPDGGTGRKSMADEKDFHAGIHQNPDEGLHGLAYADWLDENDRPAHAAAVRTNHAQYRDSGSISLGGYGWKAEHEPGHLSVDVNPHNYDPWRGKHSATSYSVLLRQKSLHSPEHMITWMAGYQLEPHEAHDLVSRLYREGAALAEHSWGTDELRDHIGKPYGEDHPPVETKARRNAAAILDLSRKAHAASENLYPGHPSVGAFRKEFGLDESEAETKAFDLRSVFGLRKKPTTGLPEKPGIVFPHTDEPKGKRDDTSAADLHSREKSATLEALHRHGLPTTPHPLRDQLVEHAQMLVRARMGSDPAFDRKYRSLSTLLRPLHVPPDHQEAVTSAIHEGLSGHLADPKLRALSKSIGGVWYKHPTDKPPAYEVVHPTEGMTFPSVPEKVAVEDAPIPHTTETHDEDTPLDLAHHDSTPLSGEHEPEAVPSVRKPPESEPPLPLAAKPLGSRRGTPFHRPKKTGTGGDAGTGLFPREPSAGVRPAVGRLKTGPVRRVKAADDMLPFLESHPDDRTAMGVYADALEDEGRHHEAAQHRARILSHEAQEATYRAHDYSVGKVESEGGHGGWDDDRVWSSSHANNRSLNARQYANPSAVLPPGGRTGEDVDRHEHIASHHTQAMQYHRFAALAHGDRGDHEGKRLHEEAREAHDRAWVAHNALVGRSHEAKAVSESEGFGEFYATGNGWIHPNGMVTPVAGRWGHAEALRSHSQEFADHHAEFVKSYGAGVSDELLKEHAMDLGHVHVTSTASMMEATGTKESLARHRKLLSELAGHKDLITSVLAPKKEVKSAHDMIQSFEANKPYHDNNQRLVYADALEESGDEHRASLHRAIAEPSEENLRRLRGFANETEDKNGRYRFHLATHAAGDATDHANDRSVRVLGEGDHTEHEPMGQADNNAGRARDLASVSDHERTALRHRWAADNHVDLEERFREHARGLHSPLQQQTYLVPADLHRDAAEAHRIAAAYHGAMALPPDDGGSKSVPDDPPGGGWWTRKSADRLPGGKGDNRPDSAFDPDVLAEGTRHEMEHTSDENIAREIAKDHLSEDPHYYRKLRKMEKAFRVGSDTVPGNVGVVLHDMLDEHGVGHTYHEARDQARAASVEALRATDDVDRRWMFSIEKPAVADRIRDNLHHEDYETAAAHRQAATFHQTRLGSNARTREGRPVSDRTKRLHRKAAQLHLEAADMHDTAEAVRRHRAEHGMKSCDPTDVVALLTKENDEYPREDPSPHGYCPECRAACIGPHLCAGCGPFPGNAKYSYVGVSLADTPAAGVLAMLRGKVRDEDLAADGREERPHVTVRYGLHTPDSRHVAPHTAGHGPITVRTGEPDVFEGHPEHDVLILRVHSRGLHSLHKRLGDNLHHTDTHPEYVPHATIAYVKPGLGRKYLGEWAGANTDTTATVHEAEFSGPDRITHPLPLGVESQGMGLEGRGRKALEDRETSDVRALRRRTEQHPDDPMGHEVLADALEEAGFPHEARMRRGLGASLRAVDATFDLPYSHTSHPRPWLGHARDQATNVSYYRNVGDYERMANQHETIAQNHRLHLRDDAGPDEREGHEQAIRMHTEAARLLRGEHGQGDMYRHRKTGVQVRVTHSVNANFSDYEHDPAIGHEQVNPSHIPDGPVKWTHPDEFDREYEKVEEGKEVKALTSVGYACRRTRR